MKKRIILLLLLFCSTFFGCDSEKRICCDTGPYEPGLFIKLSEIKDHRVKSIKVTSKKLDDIQHQVFNINYGISPQKSESDGKDALTITNDDKEGRFVEAEQQRMKYFWFDGFSYFRDFDVYFTMPDEKKEKWEFSIGKKHTYEIKMYINDKLFFTKKFSFTHKGYRSFEAELDDMKYAMKYKEKEYTEKVFINGITDDDIKKWLDGKP